MLLCGGLGNQLFQYAFARALALRSGATLVLDAVTLFRKDAKYRRTYALEGFSLPAEVVISHRRLWGESPRRKLRQLFERERPRTDRSYLLEERPLRYRPEDQALVLKRDVTLLGYWNCERYFADIERQLRRDLYFVGEIAPEQKVLATKVERCCSVAIHVRRTDYDRKLPMEYYRRAMTEMRVRFDQPKFYIFSDQTEWWLAHGESGPDICVVPATPLPPIADLRLMSLCRHFITANSSFSWWAAWLGHAGDKFVIAPSAAAWDNNEDILPESWRSIQVMDYARSSSAE